MCRSGVGTFSANAYAHPDYPYRVHYHDASRQLLMPDVWQLDNFYEERDELKPKRGADYESRLLLDTNGDGTSDDLGKVQSFDLRFVHKKTAAVAWLRTMPIDLKYRDLELRVIANGIVEGLTGTGYETIEVRGELHVANRERQYAAQVISRSASQWAGREAYAVTIDLANLDQRKIDPKSVEVRIMLVLARSGFEWKQGWSPVGREADKKSFPVLLMAGYVNTPAEFESSLPDFKGLLGRVEIAGNVGFSTPAAESNPPGATADASVSQVSASADAATTANADGAPE